jgi:hypothetical protein
MITLYSFKSVFIVDFNEFNLTIYYNVHHTKSIKYSMF